MQVVTSHEAVHAVETTESALAGMIMARLKTEAANLRKQWQDGTAPTRFFVLDNLLDPEVAERIYKAFPKSASTWFQRSSFRERKKVFAKLDTQDPILASITDAFHRPEILSAVQQITGLSELEADPELYAGGLSMMGRGDFLNPHIDNSHDAGRARYRRLNLLYYVSPNWALPKGGNLELWDPSVRQQLTIASLFNRLVVMETNRRSWHSVSPVVADELRCCVSNYYFSSNSPEEREYYHVTSFLGRPGQPARRLYGRIDNFARQFVSTVLKMQRGKELQRHAGTQR
jgi:Rps23 Pro-64 3,4-dihydroxylase Tpa1-like proline 4-hydroxylase